ncbi:MAG TPA: SRPBCC family protein, partial [Solirubrobacteraceae bacterium]|nr:SRPBCC family protein [Solirubrobacteraceae bacterium]
MRSPDEAATGHGGQEDDRGNGGGGAAETIAEELKEAVREAALEVLGPAARQATHAAARYAVSKGPELVTKNVMRVGGQAGLAQQAMSKGGEALRGMGGIGGVAGQLIAKLGRGRGDGQASGWGRNRRMPIQQVVYVSVPVKHAYNGWTEYKQWPRYMHRANQVDAQITDQEARVKVTEKMWGFKRPFTAEIVTQCPDQQIKWNSTEGAKHTGVINFHELGPRLTLVEVNLDHSPSGPVEKFARGARFVKRAVRADLHRFQGWIEMKSADELEELEGWRGTIEGGRVVKSHDDALDEEPRDNDDEYVEEP